MGQLIKVFLGILIMCGYFAYESVLYGTVIWFVWNYLGIDKLSTIGTIPWIQTVGILFIIKILLFDSSKIVGQNENNKINNEIDYEINNE